MIGVNVIGVRVSQIARNLIDCDEGFLFGSRYLIRDSDPLFTQGFGSVLKGGDVNPAPAATTNTANCNFIVNEITNVASA